jgi:opacity protein-like surface antigen
LSRSFAGDYKSIRPAVALHVGKALDPYFSLRANLLVGKVAADESKYSTPAWKQFRSFKFNTSITELSATLVFNPLGDNNRRLSPYVFAGAGVSFLNVKRDWSNLNRTVYDSKSEVQLGLAIDTVRSMPKAVAVLPVGLGLRFALGSQFSLNTEATYRVTSSDYVDGFKYSGNPKNRDNYYGLSIGLSYRLGGYKCPPVSR